MDEIINRATRNLEFSSTPNLSGTSSESEFEDLPEDQSIFSSDSQMAPPQDFQAEITRAMSAMMEKLNEMEARQRRFEQQFNEQQNANNQNNDRQNAGNENDQDLLRNLGNQRLGDGQNLLNLVEAMIGTQKFKLPSLEKADSEQLQAFTLKANLHFEKINNAIDDENLLERIKEEAIMCTWIPEKDILEAQNWPQIREMLEKGVKRDSGEEKLKAKRRELQQKENEPMSDYVSLTEDLLRAHHILYGPHMQEEFKDSIDDQIRNSTTRGINMLSSSSSGILSICTTI